MYIPWTSGLYPVVITGNNIHLFHNSIVRVMNSPVSGLFSYTIVLQYYKLVNTGSRCIYTWHT